MATVDTQPKEADGWAAPESVARKRTRRWPLVVALIAVVGALSYVPGRYLFRKHPGPQAVETAVRRLRTYPPAAAGEGDRYRFPARGVYELRGAGSERISFPPNSQRDGVVMPATVRYLPGGCWQWHVDYNVAHSEDYRFCPRGGELVLDGNGNSQSWDFGVAKVKNVAQFSCDPAPLVLPEVPQPGFTWTQVCKGTNSAVTGPTLTSATTRVVGNESLTVDGAAVRAIHLSQQTSVAGAQTGSVVEDWWHDAATGLPLRMERNIRLDSASPLGGTITYTESGHWQVVSLRPRT